MTTIALVRKNGFAAIAADTLTTFGNQKETAERVVNHQKLFKFKESYLAFSGWGGFQQALEDFFATTREKILLDSVENIFRASLVLHEALKEKYYLRPYDSDSDTFESSRGLIMIANPHGIFSVSDYRFVQEHTRFAADGSGSDYALGAMHTIYDDPKLSAKEIVVTGVNSAAEFDTGTGLPLTCQTVQLR
ncbi:MAG: hypothetical protein ACKVRN_10910 [Pyrinomonadaceae bacterium]